MAKEDFLKNEVKARILKGLKVEYLGHVTNREQLTDENNKTLSYLSNDLILEDVTNKLIDHAKLELQNVGKIPGVKEVLEIIDTVKARNFVVDYHKSIQ